MERYVLGFTAARNRGVSVLDGPGGIFKLFAHLTHTSLAPREWKARWCITVLAS